MEDAQALEVAVRAARTGGLVALARLGNADYMRWKGHRDVVSGAAIEVQDAILNVLQRETPDFGVLAEEGPEDEAVPLEAEYLWIVDPICGSLNYVQGIPYFGVSIALRAHGAIRVGAVYDPCRHEPQLALHAQRQHHWRAADLRRLRRVREGLGRHRLAA